MRTAPHRGHDVANLAALANVSVRALQRQFKKFLGRTPLDVLQDIRFECARRLFLQASPSATVTHIALRSGFRHLGRFSVEYGRRYGERPSQTLARRARFLLSQSAVRSCHVSIPDRPTIAISSVTTDQGCTELTRHILDDFAVALRRAGIGVTTNPAAARYQFHIELRNGECDFRLICRLIDMATSHHIWAHRQNGTIADFHSFDESAAAAVAGAVQSVLLAAEIERARLKPNTDLTTHDIVLRALPHVLAHDRNRIQQAFDLLGRAMERDPHHAPAMALTAWCHAQGAAYRFSDFPELERRRALELAKRALSTGTDANTFAILGHAFSLASDIPSADLVTQRALRLNGSSAWAWCRSGIIDVWRGNTESGIEQILIARDLTPDDPLAFNYYLGLGCAHFDVGRYAQAIQCFRHSINANPAAIWANMLLAPAYVLCGRQPEAQRSIAVVRALNPELTISRVTAGLSFFPQLLRDRIADGLEAAGLTA
jgi:AraC-like DNA-binding protein/tetratricopeptide (TPR) repeat protein